ncbi:cytochrome P450 315a1, mitochondrial [Cimex lectularius]|uniref:Cytochrome P450 n=1 Tax=Cimex lectularius TaxID=79782 RepID=A0A8I6RDW4_CIMLE|nr:cytochrome P450 315a1, mitochondrial [Cimex lectularius]
MFSSSTMRRCREFIAKMCDATTGIPTKNGLPILGTSLSIIASGSAPKLHKYIHRRHEESGPVFRENMGTHSAVFVSDPEIMRLIFSVDGKHPRHFVPRPWSLFNEIHHSKRGLFFMDGEEWLAHRKPLNKHFLKKDVINRLNDVHTVVVDDLIGRLKKYEGGEIENLNFELYRHSLSFVIGSLLGSSYIETRKEYFDKLSELTEIFISIFETTSKLMVTPVDLVQKLGLPPWKKFEKAVMDSLESSRGIVKRMIVQQSPNGLLDKIMEEISNFDQIVAIVVDLLIAAGDTTAIANQWAIYLMAKNRIYQKKLLENPELIRGVFRETLRLYPSAIFVTRYMPEDVTLKDYTLKKNDLVTLSLYTSGRNGEVFPDPETFLPERWLRSNEKQNINQANSFLPFAMGVRSCIGAKLAQAHITMTIQEVTKAFDLTLKEEVEMILKLVPVPHKPVRIQISSRKNS